MTETPEVDRKLDSPSPAITERDVRRSWLRYYFFAETGISYERLQALGLVNSLIPILRKLYPHKEDMTEALQRHLVFYNTEAVFGSPINGVIISMEEQRAKGEPIEADSITGLKTGLMGPMAGLGDSIDWATLKPIVFGLAASLSATGNPIGAFVMLLLPIIHLTLGLNLSVAGYRRGKESIQELLQGGRLNELILGASTMGLFMMGALSSTYIKLTTPITWDFGGGNKPFQLQSVLDGIIPGLLPLVVVLGIYWWISRKNQSLGLISIVIVAIALLTALIGLF